MFKFNAKIKVVPTIGIVALPVMLMSLVYAAAIFPPNSNPVVIGYVAQPALSNFNLLGGTEKIYRGEYEKGGWSGNLSCYPVSNAGVVSLATPCWSAGSAVGAASVVDKQGFASGSRNIATRGATGGVAFALAVNPTVLLDAAHVNFIRGDRSQEAPAAGGLRTRASVLGDSIHSRPYYHADPTSPTVFYGANDGMMHAIDAITGSERWAYIPSMLIPKLPKLWASPYVHENFVDGNVNVTNAGTAALPQNILVGVLGSGGKGIYALDVTNLTAASDAGVAAKSLWEITPTTAGFANLGDTYSNPTLYPVETGASAVIVGNGYNNTGSGVASLFVIDTKTGALIKEISTGTGTLASPNGLSTPVAIDANNNGRADFVYAGDIDGNMWKFDLSNASPANWSVSLLYSTKSNAATPAGQAITMKPDLARSPLGGYMVTFATGRILTAADQTDTAVHYAYGIWDGAPASNTTLAAQTITVRPYSANVNVRVVGAAPGSNVVPNYALGGDKGWKIALPAGERGVGDSAFIQFGRFFFNAANPTQKFTPAGGVTNSGSGENALMALDYLMGSPASPFFDMNGDGLLNAGDRVKYIAGDTIPTPSVVGDPIASNFGVPVGFVTTNGVQSHPVFGNVGGATAIFYNQNFDGTPAAIPPLAVPPPAGATGVGNGHFDVDNFYHSANNAKNNTRTSATNTADYKFMQHAHEYDKTFNVNGVNLLNPSGNVQNMTGGGGGPGTVTTPGPYWLGAAVNAGIPYKILVSNQGWNRAARLRIGPNDWISTKQYQTKLGLKVADLVTYSGNTEDVTTTTLPLPATPITTVGSGGPLAVAGTTKITNLQIDMPYNAFSVLNWWQDGLEMNGIVPINPSCVKANMSNTGVNSPNGPKGERNNGALTIQVVRADITDADIELNANGPVTITGLLAGTVTTKTFPPELFGYRVKAGSVNKYLMYEEIVYWHHPNNPCMGVTTGTIASSSPTATALIPGKPESCSKGAVVPADPTTCTVVGGVSIATPASCTLGGKYTPATPDTPAYPAVLDYTGFSITAPPDPKPNGSTPYPRPCGTNDPHNANFVLAVDGVGGGAGGGGTPTPTTPPPVVAIPTNLMGGAALGAIRPPTLCTPGTPGCTCVGSVCTKPNGGATTTTTGCVKGTAGCTCVPNPTGGETCSKPCVPNPVTGETCGGQGSQERTGRLSWRELIN